MCLYPKFVRNPKYIPNKKNKGRVPYCKDERVKWVPIGCGMCMECKKQKAREWQVRLNEEIKHDRTAQFVTLTFNQEELSKLMKEIQTEEENSNDIAKLAVKRFRERWRKKYKKSLKHWFCTELGHNGTERLHLHGFVFTKEREDIATLWKYGFVYVGEYVNERTINYCIKYVTKTDNDHKDYKQIILSSPGIGKDFENSYNFQVAKYKPRDTKEYYTLPNGTRINLPIYYRNKRYNEEERENLWIEKLDNQERWVNGIKIDVSTEEGQNEYFNILKTQQEYNIRLGYPDAAQEFAERIEKYKKDVSKLQKITKNLHK